MQDQPQTFDELNQRVMGHFADGRFSEALALLDEHAGQFADSAEASLYLRACLLVRLGESERGIGVLREALEDGLWYSEDLLRRTPSFGPIQGDPAFERLVDRFAERRHQAVPTLEPVIRRADGPARGLLLALHGNGQLQGDAVAAWEQAHADGWTVAAMASSQMMHSGAAMWDEPATALADIAVQLSALHELLGEAPAVMAGFSLGADTALAALLSGTVPASRVLMLGPTGVRREAEDWTDRLERAAGLRVAILMGSVDPVISREAIVVMADALRHAGAEVRLEVIAGLAHDYPPAADRAVALRWLLDGEQSAAPASAGPNG